MNPLTLNPLENPLGEKPFEPSEGRGDVVGKTTRRFPGEREWTLIALEDEKFWEGVADEAEWENYLAGGPEPRHWNRGKRPAPTLRPPVYSADVLTLEEALNRLGRVRVKGREWSARCPAHEDRSPSLIVSESSFKPGEPVFFCYAGCTHQQVKDALLRESA